MRPLPLASPGSCSTRTERSWYHDRQEIALDELAGEVATSVYDRLVKTNYYSKNVDAENLDKLVQKKLADKIAQKIYDERQKEAA